MNENIIISIVVPVFNVEKELDRCISSLLNQTYSQIEVILVDDGSQDNSSLLCDKYAESDDRVLVIHKKNGGLSSARNEGLRRATGQYIMYVDSDDYIEIDSCERFMHYVDEDVDFIVGACRMHKDNDEILLRHSNIPDHKKLNSREFAISSIEKSEWHAAAWLNLYKREFLLCNNLFYKEEIIYEDTQILPKLYLKARNIVYMDYAFYNYVIRDNSIMTSDNIEKKKKACLDIYSEWFDIFRVIEDKKYQRYLFGALVNFYLWSCRNIGFYKWRLNKVGFWFSIRYAVGIKEKLKVVMFQFFPEFYLKFKV